ncbi:MAG: hypothetical protein ACI4FN_05625 [Acutalibacteraceae bacterium]
MKRIISFVVAFAAVAMLFSACSPVDKDYGASSDNSGGSASVLKTATDDARHPKIMSDDKVMPQFVDISLFDEEDYSEVYLGKKFKFNVTFAGDEFDVPTNLSALNKKGWELVESGPYDSESLIYACDSVEAFFEKENVKIKATFFNSSNSSVMLKKCSIVKFRIENDFYTNTEAYNEFNVNGINNKMAITDIIDTLGTPSHFYGVSEDNYYLDYFISEKDRRNGITVYINPTDDSVTAIEFSYYK